MADAAARATVWARLWDGPTRLFHWSLVVLIGFSWWSAEAGHLDWHLWSGYGVIALVSFRLIWGLVGSSSARFASFVRGPAETLAYVRTLGKRERADVPGHNPLGALSVLAILAVLIVQVGTGLFAVDVDGLESGPLSDKVSFDTGRMLAGWHHWSFTALEVLVALHVAAVAFYLIYKRANLVHPMITGRARFAEDPNLSFAPIWRMLAAVAVAAFIGWWASRGFRL
jgi:cytochrome b